LTEKGQVKKPKYTEQRPTSLGESTGTYQKNPKRTKRRNPKTPERQARKFEKKKKKTGGNQSEPGKKEKEGRSAGRKERPHPNFS